MLEKQFFINCIKPSQNQNAKQWIANFQYFTVQAKKQIIELPIDGWLWIYLQLADPVFNDNLPNRELPMYSWLINFEFAKYWIIFQYLMCRHTYTCIMYYFLTFDLVKKYIAIAQHN